MKMEDRGNPGDFLRSTELPRGERKGREGSVTEVDELCAKSNSSAVV